MTSLVSVVPLGRYSGKRGGLQYLKEREDYRTNQEELSLQCCYQTMQKNTSVAQRKMSLTLFNSKIFCEPMIY